MGKTINWTKLNSIVVANLEESDVEECTGRNPLQHPVGNVLKKLLCYLVLCYLFIYIYLQCLLQQKKWFSFQNKGHLTAILKSFFNVT